MLADEYQDINYAQYVWVKAYAQVHGRLFVVGDDSQSIYSWRGSDITYIRRFTRYFPHAAQVALEDNFRSTGHILDAANAVIALDTSRLEKTLRITKQVGDPIEVVGFRDGKEEATGIVGEIRRRATEGLPWQDMAVLYRSNFMSRGLEEALMRAKVPYVIVGDVGFHQRAEIKDALALPRLVLNPDSPQFDEAFRRVCNTPSRVLGPKAMAALEAEAEFRFPRAFGDADEERRLAYVALRRGWRGMERVSISHVEYRRGYTRPSPFLANIPAINHVTGWLRSQCADGSGPRRIGRHYVEDVGVWDRL